MSYGSLREDVGRRYETDDNSMVRVCSTELGHNEKLIDKHSEENAVVMSDVKVEK